jgi:pimeloyl-ACP methyl ester carboxylesterase
MTKTDFVTTRDGHELFVRDWGSGSPILFLAGWSMTSDLWGEVMVPLVDRGFRAVAYDRRGHGRSSEGGVVDYATLADDLAEIMWARDLRGCTVVAHSGAVGEVIRHVTRHGSAPIERAVFVGAQGPCVLERDDNPDGLSPGTFDTLMARLKGDYQAWLDENLEAFAPQASRRTLDWVYLMVRGCSRQMGIDVQNVFAGADLRAEAARLDLPVTIIHGDRDASAPIDRTARRYAENIPGAKLIVYEGAAHGLMLTHAPRLVDDIVEAVRGTATEPRLRRAVEASAAAA